MDKIWATINDVGTLHILNKDDDITWVYGFQGVNSRNEIFLMINVINNPFAKEIVSTLEDIGFIAKKNGKVYYLKLLLKEKLSYQELINFDNMLIEVFKDLGVKFDYIEEK